MLYLALGSLSCALIATLLEYGGAAILLAQLGEILFVFSALYPQYAPQYADHRPRAMAAAAV